MWTLSLPCLVLSPYSVLALITLAGATACASVGGRPTAFEPGTTGRSAPVSVANGPSCGDCNDVIPMPTDVTRAIESRITELKQRGGVCSQYGAVLEDSYRNGRITIRPYMWRVGDRLASGVAGPNGEMTLAREIDSLNVGLRTVDDLLWSMEHEAVHIAFNVVTGVSTVEDRANPYVRACRADAAPGGAGSR